MAEKSGVHLTGDDSGWPVASAAEPQPHKDGTGDDEHAHAGAVADGVIQVDEVQILTLQNLTGGTFKLTALGQQTAALAYIPNPSDIQFELEVLSNVGVGNVAVSFYNQAEVDLGGDNAYKIEFQGTLKEQDVAQITVQDVDLTGAGKSAVVTTLTPGA